MLEGSFGSSPTLPMYFSHSAFPKGTKGRVTGLAEEVVTAATGVVFLATAAGCVGTEAVGAVLGAAAELDGAGFVETV